MNVISFDNLLASVGQIQLRLTFIKINIYYFRGKKNIFTDYTTQCSTIDTNSMLNA